MRPWTAETTTTRVCVLTPEARGALAVIRVWGPRALEIADAVFQPARGLRLSETPRNRPRFGRVGAGSGDEVVAMVFGAEPPEVEIHGHGGPAAVSLVVEALIAAGAERRQPIAWVRTNARSRTEAEALVELARAPTFRVAEILLEQAQGALEREFDAIDRQAETDRNGAIERCERLAARASVGLRLISGWSIALAGRPNVGKSRLFNALAGYDRAIVDPSPGTTRDVVTLRTAFDGWPVVIADTAGLRDAPADAIESAGIELARARHAEADLTLLVVDRSEPLPAFDHALIEDVRAAGGLIVGSKSDLPAAWDALNLADLTVSAHHGEGMERLILEIARRLVPDPPGPGEGLPFRPSHRRRIESVLRGLRGEIREMTDDR